MHESLLGGCVPAGGSSQKSASRRTQRIHLRRCIGIARAQAHGRTRPSVAPPRRSTFGDAGGGIAFGRRGAAAARRRRRGASAAAAASRGTSRAARAARPAPVSSDPVVSGASEPAPCAAWSSSSSSRISDELLGREVRRRAGERVVVGDVGRREDLVQPRERAPQRVGTAVDQHLVVEQEAHALAERERRVERDRPAAVLAQVVALEFVDRRRAVAQRAHDDREAAQRAFRVDHDRGARRTGRQLGRREHRARSATGATRGDDPRRTSSGRCRAANMPSVSAPRDARLEARALAGEPQKRRVRLDVLSKRPSRLEAHPDSCSARPRPRPSGRRCSCGSFGP